MLTHVLIIKTLILCERKTGNINICKSALNPCAANYYSNQCESFIRKDNINIHSKRISSLSGQTSNDKYLILHHNHALHINTHISQKVVLPHNSIYTTKS